MEDYKIIDLFLARSEQAITELSAKYGKLCFRLASNILGNPRDAEECVNDAYLGLWNSIPPQRPRPLSAYLFRVVRNLSVRKYHSNAAAKRNSFYDTALDELEECLASASTIEGELSAKEFSDILNRFLDQLDAENRVMFVRRYWYSDSVSEIASAFHMSSNTVSARLSRTRKRLKSFLAKEGYEI